MYFKSTCSIAFAIFVASSGVSASSNDNSALIAQARVLALSGHYEDAILNYTEAVELQPADDALRLDLASLLRDTGDVDGAIVVLKIAVDSGSRDPRVHLLYGELIEASDSDVAYRQYQATIDADPASSAAFDAVANLNVLDEDANSDTGGSGKAHIEWSETFDNAGLEDLGNQLDGQWCVQLVDIYHHEAGMCMNDPLAGDLAVIEDYPTVDLWVDTATRRLVSTTLSEVTEVSVPNPAIESVDIAVGDHYQTHTVNFEDGRYLDINLSDANNRQCIQIQQFERDRELVNCSNAYTLCRCE